MDNKVTSAIIIDGKQAINTLGKLELEASEIRNEMKGLKKTTQDYIDLSRRQKEVTAKIKAQRKELGLQGMTMRQLVNYQKELKRELETTTTRGTAKYKELGTELRNVNNRLTEQRKALRGTQKRFNVFRSSMGKLVGMVGGVYALFAALRSLYGTIQESQKATSKLAAVLGTTRSAIRDLTKDAWQYGKATQFTTKEVIELQTELAKLGFARQEIKELTKSVLDFAAAADTDLANAAAVLGATVRAFNMEAKDAQRIVDVAAKSFSSSAFDIEKFNVAMAAAAPAANAANFSVEKTTALMGVLIDRGLDASTVGTSFRNMLLRSAAAGKTFEEQLEEIRTATDANAKALELFGTRGATSALILSNNAEAAEILESKLLNAAGAADAMAKEQLDNLAGASTRVSSAWDGVVLSLENGEGPFGQAIKGVLDLTAAALGAFSTLSGGGTETMMDRILGAAPEDEAKRLAFFKETLGAFSSGIEALEKQAAEMQKVGGVQGLLNGPAERKLKKQIDEMKAAESQLKELIESGVRSEKKAATDKARIERNLANEKKKIQQERARELAAQLDKAFAEETQKLKLQYAQGILNERQFNEEMATLKMAHLHAKKEALSQGGLDVHNIQRQILDTEYEMALVHLERIKQTEKDQTQFIKSQLKERLEENKKNLDTYLKAENRRIQEQLRSKQRQEQLANEQAQAEELKQRALTQTAYVAAQSAVAQAESAEGAAVAVINSIRAIIQAKMNEAVAEVMTDVLAKVPFPFNIAAAAAAAGAVNFLFNKVFPPALTKQQKLDRREARANSTRSGRKGFYHGGDTGNASVGATDEYGQIAGVVHRNELVVPSYERQNPLVLNTEAQLAATNPRFRSNIDVNNVPPLGMTPEQADTMIAELKTFKQVLAEWPKDIRGVITWTDVLAKQTDYENAKGNRTI